MRDSIKQFVKIVSEELPISDPIYEFGSFQVPEQEIYADLRPYFINKEYVGCDMRKGPGVDRILDLHNIDLPSNSVGTVLILDTIEHVEFPRKAINEIHRILNENGILVLSSVMNFPIHAFPDDYWRFTPQAFKSLLKPFNSFLIEACGKSSHPHTVVGVGFKGTISKTKEYIFVEKLKAWKSYWDDPYMDKKKELIKQFIPPVLIYLYKKFRGYRELA
jgi:SAM-dependent methyltransferase